jgi:hypothetical protein
MRPCAIGLTAPLGRKYEAQPGLPLGLVKRESSSFSSRV